MHESHWRALSREAQRGHALRVPGVNMTFEQVLLFYKRPGAPEPPEDLRDWIVGARKEYPVQVRRIERLMQGTDCDSPRLAHDDKSPFAVAVRAAKAKLGKAYYADERRGMSFDEQEAFCERIANEFYKEAARLSRERIEALTPEEREEEIEIGRYNHWLMSHDDD